MLRFNLKNGRITDEEPIDTIRATFKFFTSNRGGQIDPASTALTENFLTAIAQYLSTNPDRSKLSTLEKTILMVLGRTEKDRKIALRFQSLLQKGNDANAQIELGSMRNKENKLEILNDLEAIKIIFPALTNGKLQNHSLFTPFYDLLKKYYGVDCNINVARKIANEYCSNARIEEHIQQYIQSALPTSGMYGPPPTRIYRELALEELARTVLEAELPQSNRRNTL